MNELAQHTLDALIDAITAVEVRRPAAEPELTSLTADSRAVGSGSIFVAVRGTRVDGHEYIPGAVAAGAAAAH